jgi:hypothetical protein
MFAPMGLSDMFGTKAQKLEKAKERQDKRNQELRAEIMLMNSQKETKQLQKELDDLRRETLV